MNEIVPEKFEKSRDLLNLDLENIKPRGENV